MDDWDEMDDSAYDGRSRRQSHDDDEPNGKKQSRRQRDNIRAQRRNKKRTGADQP
jgi:hypothetical protein